MPQEALASFNLQYNNLVDRFSRSAANSSPSGNVGKRKHRNNVIDIDPTDARSKQLVEEIVKNGDLSGDLTEELLSRVMNQHGAKEYFGQYAGKKGFDGVFDLGFDKDGFLVIIDAKQMHNLSTKLSSKAAGNTLQLSKDWIEAVVEKLKREVANNNNNGLQKTIDRIQQAQEAGKIKTAIFAVDRHTSQVYLTPVVATNKR